MDKIPLYKPLPLSVDESSATQVHWRPAADGAAESLRAFLCVPDEYGVLLLDRATHAMELAFSHILDDFNVSDAVVPNRTYRAAVDAAEAAGLGVVPSVSCSPRLDLVVVPTSLGGTALHQEKLDHGFPCVYDLAHTCYPKMFAGLQLSPDGSQFVVLSFYPTKPLGAFGGGLLVGTREAISKIRERAYPLYDDEECLFYYPATIQSLGIVRRITEYDAVQSVDRRYEEKTTYGLVRELLRRAGFVPVWAEAVSPHVLAFIDPSGSLVRLCDKVCIEVGSHYPPIDGDPDAPDHTSVPFWTRRVLGRLRGLLEG